MKFILISFICVSLIGCSLIPSRHQTYSKNYEAPPVHHDNIVVSKDSSGVEVINLVGPMNTKIPPEKRVRIPVEINQHVESWIHYFSVKDHARFQRFLDRGQAYKDVVENTLEENDLPAELYYLAMIESGFRTDAFSHAKAAGVWQFISGTARRYGLRVDQYVDERKDPIRATEAAAKYLRDLYNVFGSWHLAMAAYNAGEIRVLRAVFKGRTRNFWDLIEAKALPRETANYVPKFLAVVLIGQNPEKYGFHSSRDVSSYPNLVAIPVHKSLSLKQIAKASNIDVDTLKNVNPHLANAKVPPSPSMYEIWVPSSLEKVIQDSNKKLAALVPEPQRRVASKSHASPTYRVKRGDNLISIAKKHKLSVGHLVRINHLKSTRIYVGMRLRTQSKVYEASSLVRYKVKRGDNLTILAQKFKTSIRKIKAGNRLRKNNIFVGQVLKIEVAGL